MGHYTIKTPDIGEGIAEVELVAWHVQVGDTVRADQLLADVMTDKATVEIPSPVAGTVLALNGAIGETVAVGSELVRLEVAGAGNAKPAAAGATVAGAPVAQSAPAAAQRPAAPPAAPALPTPAASARSAADAAPTERPIASPAVRRRAWELGIDLAQVAPGGAGGRIMHADLDHYARTHPGSQTARTVSPAQTPQAPPAREQAAHHAAPPALEQAAHRSVPSSAYAVVETQQEIPVLGLRRKIAAKMQESKRRIPHFTYVEEADVTELEVLREQLNGKSAAATQTGVQRARLTLLPLLARALVLALREFPQINARFDDERGVVTRFGAVHLGMATQTGNGLMVPVLRHLEALDLWQCAQQMAHLAEATRSGRVTREELSGSTITLTSLGALGGIVSTPVINHPEVAIVGVNRIVERPVVLRGAVVVRKMMNLSSSFDHRVVDGADAARFVQSLRGYLEVPATLFVA